jgi:hypothetical protein
MPLTPSGKADRKATAGSIIQIRVFMNVDE